MRIHSEYYADDDRIEIIGEEGILFINRYTTTTVDLPPLMLFKDGKTTAIPVQGIGWRDSFIATTMDMIEKLRTAGTQWTGQPAKLVLSTLAAIRSAASGQEIRPDDIRYNIDGIRMKSS